MAITKVSSGVISANAVTATIVAENVITSSEIATDGVGTLQIADDAVTSAKLDTNIDIAGTLDVTGVLTADSNVVIAGNLTVNGTTVTNSATNTTIEDALIELGTGTTGTPANDAGIIIERGDSNNAFMGFDESADKFIVATTTATGASTGDLTLTAAPLVTGALTASGLSYPTSDGSANQVIKTDGSGNLSFVTAITDGAVVHNYTATGDGSTVTFDTGINPQDEVNTWVHIDGVYQNKSEYSYNGTSITFTTAPDSGAAIDVITGNQNGFSTADSVLGVYSTTTTDTDTYDTGLSASTENNVNIFIEGVYQPKSTYTWSGSTITFDANTPTGLALEVIASKTLTSGAVVTGSITDSAVTTAKIADNAITSAKIVNNSITGADISATTNIVANTFTGALTGNVTGNVTGNLTGTIQTAAQTNITSLGTLTALTGGTGDLNWNSGTLFVDSSANRVGIGTTSPGSFSLEVDSGSSSNVARFISTGHNNVWIQAGTSSLSQILFADVDDQDAGKISYEHANDALAFRVNAAERMRITSTGNVGIGTTNPSAKLDVYQGELKVTGTLANWSVDSQGVVMDFTRATTSYIRASNAAGQLQFQTGGSNNRMIINSSGNVGIGYSTPTNKLQIGNTGHSGYALATISDTYGAVIQVGEAATPTTSAALWVRNKNNGGTVTEIFRANADGNVGIGTTSPKTTLNLAANNSGQGPILTLENTDTSITSNDVIGQIDFYANDGSTNGTGAKVNIKGIATSTAGTITALTFGTADSASSTATEKMRIDASGNLFIGGTSSTSKPTGLNKAIYLQSQTDNDVIGYSLYTNEGTNNRRASFFLDDANGVYGFDASAGTGVPSFVVNGNGNERMRIDSSGNLLVGTTSTGVAAGGSGTSGININANGGVELARSANPVLFVNRTTANGAINQWRYNGATVGELGSYSSVVSYLVLDPRTNGTGIVGLTNEIAPTNESGNPVDGTKDLGDSARRWKDLYLSGGAYLGGTGAANKLDDYEEGTWTPAVGGNGLASTGYARYTKIGNLVQVDYEITLANQTSGNQMAISGLPFSISEDAAGIIAYTTSSTVSNTILGQVTSMFFYTSGTTISTLANYSGKFIRGQMTYRTA